MPGASRRTKRELDRAFEGSTGSLAQVRAAVAAVADTIGLDRDLTDRLKLVANELAINAVEASPGADYHLSVKLDTDGDVMVTVRNHAPLTALPSKSEWGPTELLAPRGRGLAIVDTLAKSVDISESDDQWLVISARLGARRGG